MKKIFLTGIVAFITCSMAQAQDGVRVRAVDQSGNLVAIGEPTVVWYENPGGHSKICDTKYNKTTRAWEATHGFDTGRITYSVTATGNYRDSQGHDHPLTGTVNFDQYSGQWKSITFVILAQWGTPQRQGSGKVLPKD